MKRLAAILLCMALLATGCSEPQRFHSTDISAADWGKDFHLTDHAGQSRRLADFKGKAVVLFFGYTQCPDICPTTLGKMKIVMDKLGADADKVRVVFITVDPERDTPEVLKAYMAAFNPSFIGAYTDPDNTKKMAKQFQVVYEKEGAGPNYIVNHTANLYLLDENGKTIVSAPYEAKPEAIVHDIQQMLAAQKP